MPDPSEPAYGMLALVAGCMLVVAFLIVNVKFRAVSGRGLGVRVYDFGADLRLPPTLHSRGYQFAVYLTMKSLTPESAEYRPSRVTPRVGSR